MNLKKELSEAEQILSGSQDWILVSMHSLNFPGQTIGICKGLAHRAIKAFHSQQLDYF